MPTPCTHLAKTGQQCKGWAIKKTRLCFLHTFTPARDAALKKAAEATNQKKLAKAQQRLSSLEQQRADALPKVMALAEQNGLDAAVITSEHLEDVHRLAAYISSLLLQGKINPACGQSLAAWARLSIQARELEADLETNRLLRARGINV